MPAPDVWGAIIGDALAGKSAFQVVERHDGFVMAFDAHYLLAPFESWDDEVEKQAMCKVRGRVLDVGCSQLRRSPGPADCNHAEAWLPGTRRRARVPPEAGG